MSANEPQMRTRSEVKRNTAQSSCAKSSVVSKKLKDIKTYGNKLAIKKKTRFAYSLKMSMGFLRIWDTVRLPGSAKDSIT